MNSQIYLESYKFYPSKDPFFLNSRARVLNFVEKLLQKPNLDKNI